MTKEARSCDDPYCFNHKGFNENSDGYDVSHEVSDLLNLSAKVISELTTDAPEERSLFNSPELAQLVVSHPLLAIGIALIAQKERNYISELDVGLHWHREFQDLQGFFCHIKKYQPDAKPKPDQTGGQ